MAATKDELAAELVWCYVERLRTAEDPALVALDRPELERLIEALEVAGQVPEALGQGCAEECRSAVRDRLQSLLSRHSRTDARPSRPERPSVVPAWQFRLALAATLVLGLLVSTVNGWHRSPAPVQRVAVWREPQGLEPIDETQALQLIPKMIQNELTAQQEKNLMGHLLVCPGCFEEYRALKGSPVVQLPHAGAALATHRH